MFLVIGELFFSISCWMAWGHETGIQTFNPFVISSLHVGILHKNY